jgi:hypothetical protein
MKTLIAWRQIKQYSKLKFAEGYIENMKEKLQIVENGKDYCMH